MNRGMHEKGGLNEDNFCDNYLSLCNKSLRNLPAYSSKCLGSHILSEGGESGCSALWCLVRLLLSVGRDCGHLKGLEKSSSRHTDGWPAGQTRRAPCPISEV